MLWHRSILVPGTHLYCVLDISSSSWSGKKTKKTSGYSMIVMLASLSANQQLSNGTNNFIVNLKCLTFFCCTYIIHSVLLELHYRYQHSLGFVVSSSIWFCLKSKVVVFLVFFDICNVGLHDTLQFYFLSWSIAWSFSSYNCNIFNYCLINVEVTQVICSCWCVI